MEFPDEKHFQYRCEIVPIVEDAAGTRQRESQPNGRRRPRLRRPFIRPPFITQSAATVIHLLVEFDWIEFDLKWTHSTAEMKDSLWRRLLDDLVEICFESSAIASPVVTSESPEGFLPEIGKLLFFYPLKINSLVNM